MNVIFTTIVCSNNRKYGILAIYIQIFVTFSSHIYIIIWFLGI